LPFQYFFAHNSLEQSQFNTVVYQIDKDEAGGI
jgi:hypothetical protein